MVKYILASMLTVMGVTFTASPAEACPGGAALAPNVRAAAKRIVCRVVEPRGVTRYYAVPAFVVTAPVSIPKPMTAANVGDLQDRVARLEKNQADAGRALLFGANTAAPALKAATPKAATTVTVKVSGDCPNGSCPATPVRSFLRRR